MWYATVVSVVLFGLLIAAFTFIALVVTAYAGPAGWLAIAATTFFGAVGFGVIIWQSPMFSAAIGQNRTDMMTTDMKIYGCIDEKRDGYMTSTKRRGDDSGYATDGRQENGYASGGNDAGYDSEKRTPISGQYVDEKPNWGLAAHVPITPGDHYYEERRTSRSQRTSAPAPKYYEYENEKV